MIDTHAHIYFKEYDGKFEEILKNAKSFGVDKIIIPTANPDDFKKVIQLIEKYDCLFGAVGVHPSDIDTFNEETAKQILKLGEHPKIIAIGEIGLDYYWDKSNIEAQKKGFKAQIELAKKLKKPIIIHDRDAHEDTFNILKEMNAKDLGVVMHCFSGSYEFAMQCIKEGFYIALGGVVTFKNAKKSKEVAQKIPLEYLLLETDSPFLTPEPHRGEENQPAYVKFAAEKIAELRDISLEQVDEITTKNAERLFNLKG